jgi:hypothetical protein
VYESISLNGVSVWWLKIGFWLWQIESVSVCHDSSESVLKNRLFSDLKLYELAIKNRSVPDQNQPTPISYF